MRHVGTTERWTGRPCRESPHSSVPTFAPSIFPSFPPYQRRHRLLHLLDPFARARARPAQLLRVLLRHPSSLPLAADPRPAATLATSRARATAPGPRLRP